MVNPNSARLAGKNPMLEKSKLRELIFMQGQKIISGPESVNA
jgi:hypothetical protein